MFDLADVAALKLISAVLLLQQLQISVDLFLFLISELFLHAVKSLLLCLLSNTTLETLTFDALLKKLHLILVVCLNGIYHQLVLKLLLDLILLELAFLLE